MPPEALAPVPEELLLNAQERVPESLKTFPKFESLLSNVLEEIRHDYHFSIRKAIGEEFVLLLSVSCGYFVVSS